MDLRPRRQTDWKKLHEGETFNQDRSSRIFTRATLPGLFCVDRLLAKKNTLKGDVYLVQWKVYSSEDCTWEPEHHLPRPLILSFYEPDVSQQQIARFFLDVERGLKTRLRSHDTRFAISCPLDVYRAIYHRDSEVVLTRDDFQREFLSDRWWYHIDTHGEGTCIDFPVRVWPRVRMISSWVVRDGAVHPEKTPEETVHFAVLTKACDISTS